MAIKRIENGKWSVKGSNKYITYKRVMDLTKEDKEVLKNYNLKQATYYYIGKCGEAEIDNRHNKFKWDVLNKTKGNKNVHIKEETAIAYKNILRFFIEHKGLTKKEAEDYVFRSEECFKIYKEGLTEKESEELEKSLFHSYAIASKLTNIVLLYNRDSQVQEQNNTIKLKNSRKNQKFVSAQIEVKVDIKTKETFLIIDNIEIKVNNLKFTQIKPQNGILEEEKLKIKNPSDYLEDTEGF